MLKGRTLCFSSLSSGCLQYQSSACVASPLAPVSSSESTCSNHAFAGSRRFHPTPVRLPLFLSVKTDFANIFHFDLLRLAVSCMRILAVGWWAYTIWRTADIRLRFHNLLVEPTSPCHYDFFPTYFKTRFSYQIPELVLACTGCLSTLILGWHLVRVCRNSFDCMNTGLVLTEPQSRYSKHIPSTV